MILFFVGFQATVATIATTTQSPLFQLKYIISKFSQIFSDETFRILNAQPGQLVSEVKKSVRAF